MARRTSDHYSLVRIRPMEEMAAKTHPPTILLLVLLLFDLFDFLNHLTLLVD